MRMETLAQTGLREFMLRARHQCSSSHLIARRMRLKQPIFNWRETMKSSNWKNGVRAKLTDRQLEKVSRLALARTEAISRNPMRWVPNDQIVALDPEALEQSGFRRFLRTEDLPFVLRDLNAEALESAEIASRIKKGKPRPKSHGVMPSANVFEHTVAAYMKGASPASREGAIKLLELNAQFGSAQKATTYKTGFRLIVEPFHIGFWSEVDFG